MITSARFTILWTLSKYMYLNIGVDQNKIMFSTCVTSSKKNALSSTDKRMKFSSENSTLTYTSVYWFFKSVKKINDMRVEFHDLYSICQCGLNDNKWVHIVFNILF